MTVRAVLARSRGSDPSRFEGVYLHDAGPPVELGPVLWTLMRDRYQFDASAFAREMIDGNPAGWSNIYALGGPLAKTWDGTTKLTVEQHQENVNAGRDDDGPTSFQDDPTRALPGITAPPIDDTSDNGGADLVYVVGTDALVILAPESSSGPYEVVASVPWRTEPDWDAVQEQLEEAFDDDDDSDDELYDEEQANAGTNADNAAIATSHAMIVDGDIAGAQAHLLEYLRSVETTSPGVLANLYFTLARIPVPPAELAALNDRTLAAMNSDPRFLTAALVDNVSVVLNNVGRGADSVRLFERALAGPHPLSANCYVGMTYGAYASQDPELMRRAVDHVERAMADTPDLLAANPAVFDNTGGLYVALGNKARALDYVRLCKEHGYENFAAMPTMPDYAAIKDDPEFKKLFRRPRRT